MNAQAVTSSFNPSLEHSYLNQNMVIHDLQIYAI